MEKSTVQTINDMKKKGNDLFKMQDYLKALNQYEDTLSKVIERENDIKQLLTNDLSKTQLYLNEVKDFKATLFNNISLCHFKRKEFAES